MKQIMTEKCREYSIEETEQITPNQCVVVVYTESGCDPKNDEYSAFITVLTGTLDITSTGGVDDITLIKDAVEGVVLSEELPEEGATEITLKESGEREDVFWHKYYVVEKVVMTPHA